MRGDGGDGRRYKEANVTESGAVVSVIKKGDRIYYDSRAGYCMFIENGQFTIIQEHDVVVVV